MTKNLFLIESLYPKRNKKQNMKIGALYALLSVITWSIISVITRFCLLNYKANILVFASMQIFAGGVALLLIRKPVTAEGWKAGVGYSWLYTCLLYTSKKASAGYYDNLPTEGNDGGQAFRDLEWEAKIQKICQDMGIGAQFGGKYWVHDVRVIRMLLSLIHI